MDDDGALPSFGRRIIRSSVGAVSGTLAPIVTVALVWGKAALAVTIGVATIYVSYMLTLLGLVLYVVEAAWGVASEASGTTLAGTYGVGVAATAVVTMWRLWSEVEWGSRDVSPEGIHSPVSSGDRRTRKFD